jgi:hypothetical protein
MRTQDFGANAPHALGTTDDVVARRLRRIAAFNPECRRYIREFTSCSVQLEDLADSFPALLFALATGYGEEKGRQRSFEMVMAGAPLRAASDALGLPWWLRKLPASAFSDPLTILPADAETSLRLASLVPLDPTHCASWLQAVCEAHLAGGRDFALWMARHGLALGVALTDQRRAHLAAWVWASRNPGAAAHMLVRRPWSPDMGIKRVLEEFTAWSQRVALVEWLGSGRLKPWIPDAAVHGYHFRTLRSVEDFMAAAAALDNCLEQYADRLKTGACVVTLISKAGRPVACVEVAPHEAEGSMPSIVQLRGVRNRRAPLDVWQAVYAWLGQQPVEAFSPERLVPPATDRIEMRRRLWLPYLAALAAAPGGHVLEARVRALVLARNTPLAMRNASRAQRPILDEPTRRTRRLARFGLHDAVLQRLVEIFPRGDVRR